MPTEILPSTRGYLIRAMHEWCSDNGFAPHIAVAVDGSARVPMQHVVKNEIVLNIGTEAMGGLVIGNDFIQFKARFGGVPQDILVPVGNVIAIYARENGQGMAFPFEPIADDGVCGTADVPAQASKGLSLVEAVSESDGELPDPEPPSMNPSTSGKTKPTLRRVK